MFILLDSGAFSAWASGAEVDIDEYIKFIYDNQEVVSAYVALDVIPGKGMRHTPSPEEVEESARASWGNLMYMEGAGLTPIPVFHQGERFYWLDRMVKHGCEYIGISPANDRSTKAKCEWLDRVFDFLCDEDGVPCVKTHAFGATSVDIIVRYPWTTCDSTTWIGSGSQYGLLRIPRLGANGEWDVTRPLTTLRISKESPKVPGQHFDFLAPQEKAVVTRFIEECGCTLEDVIEDRYSRNLVNAYATKLISDKSNNTRFKRFKNNLFGDF